MHAGDGSFHYVKDTHELLLCDESDTGIEMALGLGNCFMSSRFNNYGQSRYSPIEGEALTMFWEIYKADYLMFVCDKLYIGMDSKPLLPFFRKNYPKPLDQIVNKHLKKFVSEVHELRVTIFQISGVKAISASASAREEIQANPNGS